jgi:hypothetical protein
MSQHHTFPWGAVYRADRTGRATSPDPVFGRGTPWKLFSAKVSQTRLWASSSAQFTLTRRILSTNDRKLDLAKELDIAPEDPIIIDMGYASALFSDKLVTRRNRVFFGYVDTINAKCTSKGVKVTISCRDSMRFLIDNKFSGQIFGQNWQIYQSAGAGAVRSQEQPLTLNEVADAMGIAAKDFNSGVLDKHKIIGWLIYAGSNGGCLPAPLVEHFQPGDTEYKTASNDTRALTAPAIEKSTRPVTPPQDVDGGIMGFNIMNRFPLEVIKHIASLEAQPRELFAEIGDEQNGGGQISWKTRFTDNFDNPYVLSFLVPATINGVTYPPNVISAETDWSTIGTISELIVVNPQAQNKSAGDPALPSAGVVNVSGRLPDDRFFAANIPDAFPGLRHFTRRTRYIFDDTITSTDIANAQGLVDAMFRIWGKDVRAGTAIIPGDEGVRAGTAVRIFNFGFFEGETFRAEAVTHQLVAQGPAKGFKTAIAFAEADENKIKTINAVKKAMSTAEKPPGQDWAPYIVHQTNNGKPITLDSLGNTQDTSASGG